MRLRTDALGILISMRKRVTNLAGKHPDNKRDDNDAWMKGKAPPFTALVQFSTRSAKLLLSVSSLMPLNGRELVLFYFSFLLTLWSMHASAVSQQFALVENARGDNRKLLRIHSQFIYREIKNVGSDVLYLVTTTMRITNLNSKHNKI